MENGAKTASEKNCFSSILLKSVATLSFFEVILHRKVAFGEQKRSKNYKK
jgi:hypothetical protein